MSLDTPVRAEYRPIHELLHEMWRFGTDTLTHRIGKRLGEEIEELREERDVAVKELDDQDEYERGYEAGKEYMQDDIERLTDDVTELKAELARWEA